MTEKQNGHGGPRPNAGRKPKKGRQRLELDPEAAKNLYLLTKYRRAVFGDKSLTEEAVVASLVESEWKAVLAANEPVEELQEPYIL